jgi:pilus assembly protein CpaC
MTRKMLLKASVAVAITVITAQNPALAAPAKPATSAKPAAREFQSASLVLASGKMETVNLPGNAADVIVSDPKVVDVQVRSGRQIMIFAQNMGDSSIQVTDASGRVLYKANIRVIPKVDSLQEVFAMVMPEANIQVTPISGGVLLTGSVADLEEQAAAGELAQFYMQDMTKTGGFGSADNTIRVLNRIKTAAPYQVNLQVRIAEVSRSLAKEIASNFTTRDDNGNGFLFGVGRGRQSNIFNAPNGSGLPLINACSRFALPTDCGLQLPFNPETNQFVTGVSTQVAFPASGGNILNLAGKLFGLDVAAAFDVAERAGLATTLAQPNLTALSGETASFQAGGSFSIPVSDNFGSISVTQQSYGVQLSYTPTVLSNGRIRLQVSPEVSDITSAGAARIGGSEIPGLLTRKAQTTVELGSGQSFMIAGLISNSMNSSVDKYPGLGDVPVLGALFKSNGWRKSQTELVIIVTPYLVKPVSEAEIKLPTDGFNAPSDLERVLLNKQSTSTGMNDRPRPTVAPEAPQGPDMGAVSQAAPPLTKQTKPTKAAATAPGFTFD